MTELVAVSLNYLRLLEQVGVAVVSEGEGSGQKSFVPEWAAIAAQAMVAAIMLTNEHELMVLFKLLEADPELQRSVVGAHRLSVKPLDIYFMLKGRLHEWEQADELAR